MVNLFNYIDRKSFVHDLTGATKLVCLLVLSLASMITFDTRFLIVLPLISIGVFAASKIKYSDISFILNFTIVFMIVNNIMVFIFSPQHGVTIYGTKHILLDLPGRWDVTLEQLLYQLNIVLKYICSIPIVLLFVSTTNPSEFAASLNKIGVNYKIAYSVSLALRYIPDIQREYTDISLSMQARGLEMSAKRLGLIKRLKMAATLIIPLIISSINRIEVISNAMELRGFGKNKKRSWYRSRKFKFSDYLSIALCVVLLLVALALNFINGGRYWNPFV